MSGNTNQPEPIELEEKFAGGQANIEIEYDEEDDDMYVDAAVEQLNKVTKIIYPSYMLFFVYSLVVLVFTFVTVPAEIVFFLILLGCNLFFSLAGAAGVYRWGTVGDQIDGFKEQNSKYEQELFELHGTSKKLHEEVEQLQEETGKLKRNISALNETMAAFDTLRESLGEVVGQGQEIDQLVKSVNGMYDNMRNTILQNKRADILSNYYEASLKDGQEGMTEREYERFLGPLDEDTRNRFKSYGSFKEIAGDDDIIDLEEFQQLVDKLLKDCEAELLKDAANKKSSNRN